MRRIVLFALCGLLASTATGQKGRAANAPLSLSYMLPRVSFEIAVTLECTERVPGPFREYAERQLGVQPAITSAGQSWRVKSVRVTPVARPDEQAMFTITSTGDHGGLLLSLSPEGFLTGAGNGVATRQVAGTADDPVEYIMPAARPRVEIEYVRFGVESTLKEVLDSNFSMMTVDDVPRRVWDPIERHVLKEKEDYVQEITNELFSTRRKRLEGMAAPGGLTGESIAELKALEEAYASLFLGKEMAWETTRVFYYTPERAGEATPLFRFSEEQGITKGEHASVMSYFAEVSNAVAPGEKTLEGGTPGGGTAGGTVTRPGLTYRVPATGNLRVYRGDHVLFEGQRVVPQLGYLKQFPLDVISSEGLTIEFHPLYGSIKSVVKDR
ncbi:MAG: DUF4831 family protein [Odoribacteraceae bacterium]|jgi:hypothetical protein|nr:DUF4831 family protein [Odoribacteraceae bacterium]